MLEGGFVPYDFFSEFERDIFDFDSADALKNFGAKQKVLFIGSFIICQYLVDKILQMRPNNGFPGDNPPQTLLNLNILAGLIHGIFCEVIYDLFKEELIAKEVLTQDESNKETILYNYIYKRYTFFKDLPDMKKLDYAWKESNVASENNKEWWDEKKE